MKKVKANRQLLTSTAMTKKLQVSRRTFQRMIKQKEFPQGYLLSGKRGRPNATLRWYEDEVDAWMGNNRA